MGTTSRASGQEKVADDGSLLMKLAATIVDFDPHFEIFLGTRPDGSGRTLRSSFRKDHFGIVAVALRSQDWFVMVPVIAGAIAVKK